MDGRETPSHSLCEECAKELKDEKGRKRRRAIETARTARQEGLE